MNRTFNSTTVFLVAAIVFFAGIYGATILVPKNEQCEDDTIWIPTEEDIKYQDSMWTIISETKKSVDTIMGVMESIIWKLERLEYEDGEPMHFGFNMECGDTLDVSATMYYPVPGQCDDTPDITADQTKIPDIYDCSHLKWIAVSQDLLWFNGGPIRYGDTVYVYAGHKTGSYIVRDAMNKRFKYKIDFLESVGTDLYSFSDAKLIINI